MPLAWGTGNRGELQYHMPPTSAGDTVPCAFPGFCALLLPRADQLAAARSTSSLLSSDWCRRMRNGTVMPGSTAWYCCRPYWFTAVIFAFIGFAYVGVKLCLLQRALRPAPLAMVLVFLGFCTAHVLIARDVMLWAQRRFEMGLLGYGYPWEV